MTLNDVLLVSNFVLLLSKVSTITASLRSALIAIKSAVLFTFTTLPKLLYALSCGLLIICLAT